MSVAPSHVHVCQCGCSCDQEHAWLKTELSMQQDEEMRTEDWSSGLEMSFGGVHRLWGTMCTGLQLVPLWIPSFYFLFGSVFVLPPPQFLKRNTNLLCQLSSWISKALKVCNFALNDIFLCLVHLSLNIPLCFVLGDAFKFHFSFPHPSTACIVEFVLVSKLLRLWSFFICVCWIVLDSGLKIYCLRFWGGGFAF